jgi:hypothetical protein
MLDGVISSILTYVFSWELKSIATGGLEWHGVVAVVDHGKSKFFEVSNKSSQNLSLWHIECRILVVFYKKLKCLENTYLQGPP